MNVHRRWSGAGTESCALDRHITPQAVAPLTPAEMELISFAEAFARSPLRGEGVDGAAPRSSFA
jgi:hypothetical protein